MRPWAAVRDGPDERAAGVTTRSTICPTAWSSSTAGHDVVVNAAAAPDRSAHRAEPWSAATSREVAPARTTATAAPGGTATDPWHGLDTRTGHREKLLLTHREGRELLVTARYLRPRHGEPVARVLLAVRDASARQRAEQDHAALISTVAHELRSPLTSVKGFSATLLRGWEQFTDEQKRFMIETIETDADRVSRLITELLDVSRLDAGRLDVRLQPVDLPAMVARHVERLKRGGQPDEPVRRGRRPTTCPRCGPTPTGSTRSSPTSWKTPCATATARSPWGS